MSSRSRKPVDKEGRLPVAHSTVLACCAVEMIVARKWGIEAPEFGGWKPPLLVVTLHLASFTSNVM